MENSSERRIRYRIERSTAGMWNVSEEGLEEPIASFEERADALEYALRLADTKTESQASRLH